MGGTYSIPGTIGFQLRGFREFTKNGFEKHSKKWNPSDLDVDMSGKVCVITGANSGLAFSATKELAKRNATVVMICRNKEKGEKAMNEVKSEIPNANIRLEILDVSRPAQVKQFADKYVQSGERLDVLINSAGVLLNEKETTPDGLDTSFATNTLGSFLMTEYLFPSLKKSAPSRVISVSSGGMYTQKMDVNDFQFNKGKYDGTRVYSQTKRHQVCLTETWAKMFADSGVTFNSMHPGWARTPGTQGSLPEWFDKLNLRTSEEGADTIVWLAVAEKVASETGKFWFDREAVDTHLSLAGTKSPEKDYEILYNYCADLKKKTDDGEFDQPKDHQ